LIRLWMLYQAVSGSQSLREAGQGDSVLKGQYTRNCI
jgi:hypothetical protein